MALSVQAQLNGNAENQVAESDSQVCLCLHQLMVCTFIFFKSNTKDFQVVLQSAIESIFYIYVNIISLFFIFF